MATFSKVPGGLSGSTDGRLIDVTATGTPGTLLHTAHATDEDEIWLYASNTTTGNVDLTIEWGGVTAADLIEVEIEKKPRGLILVVPGGQLTNSLVVRAFTGSASQIHIMGWVHRITP